MFLPLEERKRKAVVGIGAGLLIALVTAYQCYQTWIPDQGSIWALLILPALPLIGLGCSQLALDRGYPTSVAYVFLFVAVVAAVGIGATQLPATIGLAFLFVALMPPLMLWALPVRFGAMRRGYKG